ncbi:MAG: hypothetical protein H6662_19295 [Ardenticatenaceae bacterium]|nr:hypothetical protein [Anaerolineales bacterium]MCB8923732.1 hypothetical protein [Ardenticatenaceae bacterium]
MATQYHINGICEVEYPQGKKVEEFYVDDVVNARSEAQAISTVASLLTRDKDIRNLMWTQLYVKALPS